MCIDSVTVCIYIVSVYLQYHSVYLRCNMCTYAVLCVLTASKCVFTVSSTFHARGINWYVGDLAFETVNTLKGCTDHNTTSRLTKHSLFALYSSLAGKLPSLYPDDVLSDASPRSLYAEAKAINVGYREAREQLFEAFRGCSLDVWTKKPPELEQFTLDILLFCALCSG